MEEKNNNVVWWVAGGIAAGAALVGGYVYNQKNKNTYEKNTDEAISGAQSFVDKHRKELSYPEEKYSQLALMLKHAQVGESTGAWGTDENQFVLVFAQILNQVDYEMLRIKFGIIKYNKLWGNTMFWGRVECELECYLRGELKDDPNKPGEELQWIKRLLRARGIENSL